MNKKIQYIISVTLVLLLTVSCEDLRFGDAFLEMPQGNKENLEYVFSSRENSEQALLAAYKTLPDGLIHKWGEDQKLQTGLLESLTDLNSASKTYGAIEASFYPGQLTASSAPDQHKYNYSKGPVWSGIRAAWIYIENVDKVPDMTVQEKATRKAEARVIIAIHYTELLRNFGGVPWVGRSYKPDDTMEMPRMTVEDTVDKIVELLDSAIPDLPWTVSASDDGRMTAAAAMALKVRVLLFAASPLFNDDQPFVENPHSGEHLWWYGDFKQERWQAVVDAGEKFMKALMENGYYALVDTGKPREDFRSASFNRANGEVLISTRKVTKYTRDHDGFINQVQWGSGNTTLDYVDMFPMKDGKKFSWDNPEHAIYPFFDINGNEVRDPRLYETVLIPNDQFDGRTAETWIGGRERRHKKYERDMCASGFAMRKFRQDAKTPIGKFYSWPYLRLAEVYLSMAEALNEVGRRDEAYDYVSLVRTRVDLPNLSPGMTKEEFREAILTERALEFGYEEVRFYDLIRWKRDDLFRKKLRGLNTYKKMGPVYTYEQYELPIRRVWQGEGWNPKWYLSPFPVEEVNKRYGLVQNPGW